MVPSLSVVREPVLAELWNWIASHTDDEIIPRLHLIDPDNLEQMYEDAGPEDDLVPLECECGIAQTTICPTCGMEPDFKPGKNFGHYLSPRVLKRIEEILHADPPAPNKPSPVLSQEARAVVLAKRNRDEKAGLWHPKDRIHEDPDSDENKRLRRTIFTLSGWRAAGCPQDLAAPPDNGHEVIGKVEVLRIADRARDNDLRKNAAAVAVLVAEWKAKRRPKLKIFNKEAA